MQNNQRQFYIFDLEIGARKAGAVVPAMNDLIPIYQRMKNNARYHPIRRKTATLLVGDMAVDAAQQFVTLLVRLSDQLTPNSVYSDPVAGDFQEHVKVGNQGSDFGCHVLISTAPEQGLPNTYTCAIERVQGFSFALVQRLLSKLLNFEYNDDPASFSYPHPAGGLDRQGQPRKDRCCPHIELRGRPSDTLINDINNGHLSGISLVKTEAITPIAGAAYLRRKSSELKLDIDYNNLPANLWNSMMQAFQQNSGQYGIAKVSYQVPGSKRTVTIEINTANGAALTEMYILSYELTNIFPFLAQSAINIVDHLKNLAAHHFLTYRNI